MQILVDLIFRKDKTLVEILDRLKGLENKLDSLSRPPSGSIYGSILPGFPSAQSSLLTDSDDRSLAPSSLHPSGPTTPSAGRPGPYSYVSSVHKMLEWPVIHQLLESTRSKIPNLPSMALDHDGLSVILGLPSHPKPLPVEGVESMGISDAATLGLPLQVSGPTGGLQMSLAGLTWEMMQQLTKAYFNTFNFLYPILDRQSFTSVTLASVFNDGFDETTASTLTCLVFALGEVAITGIQGISIGSYKGRPSGIKGGTVDRPPGLGFFNEARKRMGFSLTECSLENVQIFALSG
jgi:hypothetical protein